MDLESYVVTDPFFGTPYIDLDEQRDEPCPYRHIHGGFTGTDTRFTFYFPPAADWKGRMYQPLEGAHAGHEDALGGPMGELIGGLRMVLRLGGYMVESNSGHIGDTMDPKAGPDPTLYGYRASAEAGRFSKHVAAQVYGEPPKSSYVFGGSGGGRRSPLCLEYGPDVWDGALPFMGGGDIDDHGTTSLVRGSQVMAFASMFNVQRLLGSKLEGVVDATLPGGSGDPFAGVTTHEREELANLYRLGFPRGDEYMVLEPMGQIWLWTAMADDYLAQDPEYFEAFWTQPGHVGHDFPELVTGDLIDTTTTVSRVLNALDLQDPEFDAPEFESLRGMAMLMAGMAGDFELPIAAVIEGLDGYRLGAGVRITSGASAGRQLYCLKSAGDLMFCDGADTANIERFRGVEPGDEVHVTNRSFLAFCYYYRHHLMPDPEFDFLKVNGKPIYPSYDVPYQAAFMGVPYSGTYEGKLLWIHHTHDSSLWPPQGLVYRSAIERAQGADAAAQKFRLWWTENAEHVPPMMLPARAGRSATTCLIDYQPVIEQGLIDLAAWVEDGVAPPTMVFEYDDGEVRLPANAADRGGIQPVVAVSANGASRAEVKAGTPVTLEVASELPPGAGTIIAVEWDFDGSGGFPFAHDVDGTATEVKLSTTHAYDAPGTYFATARVTSHRDGDVAATSCRITNLASARVVVT